jgi:hypothetical protein
VGGDLLQGLLQVLLLHSALLLEEILVVVLLVGYDVLLRVDVLRVVLRDAYQNPKMKKDPTVLVVLTLYLKFNKKY